MIWRSVQVKGWPVFLLTVAGLFFSAYLETGRVIAADYNNGVQPSDFLAADSYTSANSVTASGQTYSVGGSYNGQRIDSIRYSSSNVTGYTANGGAKTSTVTNYEIWSGGKMVGAVQYYDGSYSAQYQFGQNGELTGKGVVTAVNPTGKIMTDAQYADAYKTYEASKPKSALTDPIGAAKDAIAKGIEDAVSKIGDFLLKYVGLFFMVIGLLISWLANAFLYITAQVLEASFSMLVTNMGTYSELWSAVQEGWKAIRDVGNTLFIFVLLYAAFNTVLGRKDGLDLVPRIIIVALLVNFSYLFSTSVIDVSNEMAAKVYGQIGQGAGSAGFSGQLAKLGGYEKLMTSFSLDSIGSTISSAISNASGAISAAQQSSSVLAGFSSFVKSVFSSAFIFILGGFMLAIALTLVARFVTLVVVVVTSALAFLAYLLPRFEGQSREWWATLIGQSFYAPVVFLMLLITTGIAEKFQQSTELVGPPDPRTSGQLASLFSFGLSQFFTFCVLIGMLYASMSLAKKLSEQGSKAAISIGQRAQKYAASAAFGGAGWLGRGTLGRVGGRLADSDTLKRWSVQSGATGYVGRKLMGVGGRMNESSFDFRQSGAATALSAAVGAEYGKAGEAAQGGWKGVAEAKEKAAAARIDAVKKMDISGKDKKEKIDELAAAAAKSGTASRLGAAEQAYRRAEERHEKASAAGASAATMSALKIRLDAAKSARDQAGYQELNKQLFGVDTDDRDINYSTKYARSMVADAVRMGRIKTGMAAVGGGAAIAAFGAPAAAAVGILGAGRAVSGVVRGVRGRKAEYAAYKGGKPVKKRFGFLGAGASSQAVLSAAESAIKKSEDLTKDRNRLDALDAKEKSGVSLNDAEKRERQKLDQKFEKLDNAAKADKK